MRISDWSSDVCSSDLEQQGYVMRGTFTPEAIAARDTEWCERRRLARIHRYTRDRKRAEFQPVPAAAFMRFLFDWQGLVGSDKREGPAAPELGRSEERRVGKECVSSVDFGGRRI